MKRKRAKRGQLDDVAFLAIKNVKKFSTGVARQKIIRSNSILQGFSEKAIFIPPLFQQNTPLIVINNYCLLVYSININKLVCFISCYILYNAESFMYKYSLQNYICNIIYVFSALNKYDSMYHWWYIWPDDQIYHVPPVVHVTSNRLNRKHKIHFCCTSIQTRFFLICILLSASICLFMEYICSECILR